MNSIIPATSSVGISLLVSLLVACGFPRPSNVGGDDGPVPGDAADPELVIHVSPSGDDANDGFASPVKTLRHAIALAADNTMVTKIVLASGTYSRASGETFPYTVPPNVTIAGSSGGGAILAGSKAEPGLSVDSGGLQDLDLEDFTTAITATGTASLKNIRVLTSTLALQAQSAAKLTVDNLNITGSLGACATGIVLNGAAELRATTLMTRNLQSSLNVKDQSIAELANVNISGDVACSAVIELVQVTTTASFVLRDSVLDGGSSNGIGIGGRSTAFQGMISNTVIRNMKRAGIGGDLSSSGVSFHMTGGELSNNGESAAQLLHGIWLFTGVAIRQNKGFAIYLQDGKIVMRGCPIVNNFTCIDVFNNGTADLGTIADPGGNVFQGNPGAGLCLDGALGTSLVEAVGNTWNPNVQGANGLGKYTSIATIPGPVVAADGDNFSIGNGWSLRR